MPAKPRYFDPKPEQLNPRKVPPGDQLRWTCGICHLVTQGGRAGLNAHIAVVHPDGRK